MGHQRASELFFLGDFFDAKTAHELGIVSAVYPDEEVLATAFAKARQLTAQPAAAVRLTKFLLKQANKKTLKEVIETEMVHFRECKKSPESAEAFAAFAERRKPDFSAFK